MADDKVPAVFVVGSGGYAAEMVRAAETAAATGACSLGGIVIDPAFVSPDQYQSEVSCHRRRGWTVVGNTDELFAPGHVATISVQVPKLVVLPVPIPLHAPLTIAAIRAGFHVLCEKPAAGSLAELAEMEAAASSFGKRLWFGFQHPLNHAFSEALKVVENGSLGRLSAISCIAGWPRDEAYYRRAPWAGRLKLNGRLVLDSPLQNAMAHFLHGILEIASRAGYRAERITAEHLRANEIETADFQAVRIGTVGDTDRRPGPELFMAAAHSCRDIRDPVITVFGERGAIRWCYPDTLQVRPEGKNTDWTTQYTGEGGTIDGAALRAAVDVLADRSDPETNPENLAGVEGARRHLAVVERAFFGGAGAPGPEECRFRTSRVGAPHLRISPGSAGLPRYEIIGLDDVMENMAADRRLPSEMDVPWKDSVLRVEGTLGPGPDRSGAGPFSS